MVSPKLRGEKGGYRGNGNGDGGVGNGGGEGGADGGGRERKELLSPKPINISIHGGSQLDTERIIRAREARHWPCVDSAISRFLSRFFVLR